MQTDYFPLNYSQFIISCEQSIRLFTGNDNLNEAKTKVRNDDVTSVLVRLDYSVIITQKLIHTHMCVLSNEFVAK